MPAPYNPQPGGRDAITMALMNVSNPFPQTQLPQMPPALPETGQAPQAPMQMPGQQPAMPQTPAPAPGAAPPPPAGAPLGGSPAPPMPSQRGAQAPPIQPAPFPTSVSTGMQALGGALGQRFNPQG